MSRRLWFLEYDYTTSVANCSCNVKEISESFADMNINTNKLLENFKNIKNIINFEFLKCYIKLFNKENCFIIKTKIAIKWKRITTTNI